MFLEFEGKVVKNLTVCCRSSWSDICAPPGRFDVVKAGLNWAGLMFDYRAGEPSIRPLVSQVAIVGAWLVSGLSAVPCERWSLLLAAAKGAGGLNGLFTASGDLERALRQHRFLAESIQGLSVGIVIAICPEDQGCSNGDPGIVEHLTSGNDLGCCYLASRHHHNGLGSPRCNVVRTERRIESSSTSVASPPSLEWIPVCAGSSGTATTVTDPGIVGTGALICSVAGVSAVSGWAAFPPIRCNRRVSVVLG